MTDVIDDQIKPLVATHGWIKVVLSILFVGLSYLKSRAVFSKKAGPQ